MWCGTECPHAQGNSRRHMAVSTTVDWASCGFAIEKPQECNVVVDQSTGASFLRLALEKTVNDCTACDPNTVRSGFLKPFEEQSEQVIQLHSLAH